MSVGFAAYRESISPLAQQGYTRLGMSDFGGAHYDLWYNPTTGSVMQQGMANATPTPYGGTLADAEHSIGNTVTNSNLLASQDAAAQANRGFAGLGPLGSLAAGAGDPVNFWTAED